ncbi:galactose-3-O-sulfotransferase 2-like [Ylistrum balloti]|uniref:galactose-3-O-sulfotransferase 2-like n=1 Tax=Ylistrum balloti TaxID=509963 RepID=UPI002905DE85|nr:galactose-3-O-sulfotransferase 2-like [Ylistrum balloti]
MPRFGSRIRFLTLIVLVYILWWLIFDASGNEKYAGLPNYIAVDHNRFDQYCMRKRNIDILEEIGSNERQGRNPEARHIVFLKVHKAASSTVQNIFMRFGAVRNLVFMLPKSNSNVISLTNSVSEQNVLHPPIGRRYDILCCHVIYNKSAMQTIMPKDTVYVGLVRHPFGQFLSTIRYFHPKEFFNISGPHKLKTFLYNPTRYVQRSAVGNFLNNRMAYEFNFPHFLFVNKNKSSIQTYLRKLEKEFHMVLVADFLDESLILMRRLLGWQLKDIIHRRINDGKYWFTKVPKMKTAIKELHKQWAALDYALYDFFNKRLSEKIKSEGQDFQKELLYFKRIQRDVESFCLRNVNESMIVHASPWNDQFEITDLDCLYMIIGEEVFIQEIRHRQYVQR